MLGAEVVVWVPDDGDTRVRGGLAGIGLGAAVGDARRARLHRLLGIGGDRQRLVVDFDQVERFVGDGQVIGGHRGHGLAEEDGAIDCQERVGAGLGARLQLRDVGGGEHRAHTRQGARLRDVDARDAGVGVRAAQQPRLQKPRELHVADVLGAAGDLLGRIEARDGQADAAHLAARFHDRCHIV